jgi:hypothetical protein
MMDGTPVKTSAGKVRKDPPPATAFISPARRAAPIRSKSDAMYSD